MFDEIITQSTLVCELIPTVEEINLEYRLANAKAKEAVQHAANCGRMLLQVKASLAHGEWLPWLDGEIEAGRLEVGSTQARVYMRIAANKQRGVHLVEAPSIRAALELLSDQEPVAETPAATVAAMLAELPEPEQRQALTAVPLAVVKAANHIRRERAAYHWINDFISPPQSGKDKEHHEWGQAVCGMTAIVERFTNPGDVVLDPFLGGGTTGLVCSKLQRNFIGVECDADVASQAAGRIQYAAEQALEALQ